MAKKPQPLRESVKMLKKRNRILGHTRSLAKNESGLALIEFAFIAPVFMVFVASGAELANYATESTQVSQLALQVADNAARIGEGDPLANKKITETQINDLFTGAEIHAGDLDIYILKMAPPCPMVASFCPALKPWPILIRRVNIRLPGSAAGGWRLHLLRNMALPVNQAAQILTAWDRQVVK
jgi:hypothetical protein